MLYRIGLHAEELQKEELKAEDRYDRRSGRRRWSGR